MLKPLSAIALSTGILLMVGCEQTTVVKDNSVAAMFARSMPAGDVAQGNAIVQASTVTAVNTPVMQHVSTALNTAQNTVGPTTPTGSTIGSIANTLSPANIENAVHNVVSQATAPHPLSQNPLLFNQQPNSPVPVLYGPPAFNVGTFNSPILSGPGQVYFNIPSAPIFTPSK